MTTVAAGLSTADAARQLSSDGPNLLPLMNTVPKWRQVSAQFTHFFALMLWVAAALAFLAGMAQLGTAVVVVVVINGTFSYVQEARAAQAASKLRAMLPAQVLVKRDGQAVQVAAAEIVRGDVVLLTAGDRIPGDVEFAVAESCTVDESMLSGESEPVAKNRGDGGYGGTFLVNGNAEALITATGSRTRLASIASLTATAQPPQSPLNKELRRVVRLISVVALSFGGVFFAVSLLTGLSWRDAFLFAIGVAVALIPEGLLPTVTLSLAMGAQRMARRNALVRHLQAVETLGSTTFICTDKTGTLTQNRMSAVETWTQAGIVRLNGEGYSPTAEITGSALAVQQARRLARAARAASRGRIVRRQERWTADGDPMEAALDALAHRLARGAAIEEVPVDFRWSFDPVRKRESVAAGAELLVKGAPESVLPLCVASTDAAACQRALEDMAARGLRVLAVAERALADLHAGEEQFSSDEALTYENQLTLLGLVGLHDPPRESVPAALRAARTAGVKVAMVTGDHPSTAAAIAAEIGLLGPEKRVVEGKDLPDDDHMLGALLDRDGVVVSRVSPEQKLRVARALQLRGHVLAMTGDGVNDGPALQEADIGVAMGASGTDVAREAADLVLLDDDFATIIAAVEQGRATYANIRRFLTYHLTDNVAELTPFVVWALSGGSFPLALGVLQILFLDIGTDLLPALALGSERAGKGVLQRPPERRHLMDSALLVRVFAVLGPVEAVCEMTAFTLTIWLAGWRPGSALPDWEVLAAASGAAFTTVVLAQLANAFACRSESVPPWRLGWGTNRMLLWAVVVELAALVAFLAIPPIAAMLGQAPPTTIGLLTAVLSMPALLASDYLYKKFKPQHAAERV
ncbi:cation-transporting P-type ATPase [Arthrobacter sp. CAU 1506]|uniref:cation-translocating P-type ATPase n=1 Tax=Arthrobacter sp. CAU 1506 TaxID=2560052 RepID=UPI0010ADA12F|nr:cation-transporting P-type ATPase [Arthrobacter sp. CAU 1506]TJY70433.1 cation-transporting P-type ATPase [Arthrobacter sp. CAU 1506]